MFSEIIYCLPDQYSEIKEKLSDDIKNSDLQSNLSNDTLYVPKSLMINMKALGGKESMKIENVLNFNM